MANSGSDEQLDKGHFSGELYGPIERRTLHDMVVTRVRDMIIEGQLPSGERIHEGRLGEQLGVSRTPLREALKVLALEGLVDLVPNRGTVVKKLSPKDVRDMITVLGALERLAGQLICENATEAEIAEVRRVHDEMLECFRVRDRLNYFKRNQFIHSLLISYSRNESLALMHGMLQSRLRRVRFIPDRNDETLAAAVADHEEIVCALEARDSTRLSRALEDHVEKSWDRIRSYL